MLYFSHSYYFCIYCIRFQLPFSCHLIRCYEILWLISVYFSVISKLLYLCQFLLFQVISVYRLNSKGSYTDLCEMLQLTSFCCVTNHLLLPNKSICLLSWWASLTYCRAVDSYQYLLSVVRGFWLGHTAAVVSFDNAPVCPVVLAGCLFTACHRRYMLMSFGHTDYCSH